MRQSDPHRRALDSLQASIASAIDCATRVKKTVSRYHQWLLNCRRLLRRIAGGCKACTNTDTHLHPQVLDAQNDAFTRLGNSCEGFDVLMEKVWIEKAQQVNDAAAKKVDENSARLKRIAQALPTLYEHFMSHVRRQPDFPDAVNALESGWTNHCVYMRYFHEIEELEGRFEQGMADLTKTINDMNFFLDRSSTQVNQLFVKRFGKNIAGETQAKLSTDFSDSLRATTTVALASLSQFKQPAFAQLTVYQFMDPLQMKFTVKERYDSMHEKELSVAQDDVVEMVDTSNVEYWWVKKSDGQEGFLPSTILKPMPVVVGTRRQTTIAQGPPSLRD
jgi:hypothetical protein